MLILHIFPIIMIFLKKISFFPLSLGSVFVVVVVVVLNFYLFMAVLGLRSCARAFSSCGKRGPLFITVRGPLTIAASLVADHRLQMCRLSNCGSWAQLLRGMWESSQTRARTRVPCIGRQILNHCATREALGSVLINKIFSSNFLGFIYSFFCPLMGNMEFTYFQFLQWFRKLT